MSTAVHPNDRVRFKVIYEGGGVIVVLKPPGVVTQPGAGHERDSLLNGLFSRRGEELRKLGAARDFGLLHRLDRETSGLVALALRPESYDHLRRAFEARRVGKYYWALTAGIPRSAAGVVRRHIAEVQARPDRRPGARVPAMKLARVSGSGKPAVTAYRVLGTGRGVSLVECRTLTGRLHQVRVHMASIGCPILGDGLYAPEPVRAMSPRLALHAHRLILPLPEGGKLDCTSGWPPDLRGVLKRNSIEPPAASDRALIVASRGIKGGEELDGDGIGDEKSPVGE